MTKQTKQATGQRDWQRSTKVDAETPLHVELAAAAMLAGWTHEQVIDTLIGRISRDRRYLAYRKACNRRTSYDDQVQQDMRALALAACWLAEHGPDGADRAGVARPNGLGRHPHQQPSGGKAQEEVAAF